MASTFQLIRRGIATTVVTNSKKTLRKFDLYNKRGTKAFKERQRLNPDPDIPIHNRGTRPTGFMEDNVFIEVKETIPELIVPDLEGCELKPYVSYQSTRVTQSEFTARDLFNAIYAKKITDDFNNNKLDDDGNPLEPNEHELLTRQEAKDRAARTGTDLFEHPTPPPPHPIIKV